MEDNKKDVQKTNTKDNQITYLENTVEELTERVNFLERVVFTLTEKEEIEKKIAEDNYFTLEERMNRLLKFNELTITKSDPGIKITREYDDL